MQPELHAIHDTERPLSVGSTRRIDIRYLRPQEKPYFTPEQVNPLVVERRDKNTHLGTVLSDYSLAIRASVVSHGAVLFRGFGISAAAELESSFKGLAWAEPMGGYFMAEPGRSLDVSAHCVFHTNSFFKTGGSFSLPGDGFHSENYYSTDVPRWQAFWCAREPWLGGETGLCFMSRSFASLAKGTRQALQEAPICFPRAWTLRSIAQRYGVQLDRVRQIIDELQLLRQEVDGRDWLILEKPSIIAHPESGALSLQVNISREVPRLTAELHQRFKPSYADQRWALHRAAWKRSNIRDALEAVELAYDVAREPREGFRALFGRRQLNRHARNQLSQPIPRERRLAHYLAPAIVAELAEAMWKHSAVFSWMQGDVLLLDNFQVLHAGMPGLGPRELRVMLFGPTFVSGAANSGGLHDRLTRDLARP